MIKKKTYAPRGLKYIKFSTIEMVEVRSINKND